MGAKDECSAGIKTAATAGWEWWRRWYVHKNLHQVKWDAYPRRWENGFDLLKVIEENLIMEDVPRGTGIQITEFEGKPPFDIIHARW